MGPLEHHRPKRSLGQNFLVDPNLQRKITQVMGAGPDDDVLEIGPGRGALTRHLVGTVRRLVLVELDDALARSLEDQYGDHAGVTVVHGDILDLRLADLVPEPGSTRVVGNIPYNITTPILFHLLERPRPLEIVLMVQQEVAERITAPSGTGAYGALAVGVQSIADAERLFRVGKGAFRPVPRVDSEVIRIRPFVPAPLSEAEEERLRTVVRAAFQWRRKQLGKILRDHPDLTVPADAVDTVASAVGFATTDRPERLAPDDFVRLAAHLP